MTRTARPASPKQTAFIGTLVMDRQTEGLPNLTGILLGDFLAGTELSSQEASSLITALLSAPRVPGAVKTPTASAALPDVRAGHYALETDGIVKFYRVDRPTQGRWNGYTFVKVQASDDFYPVKGEGAREVLTRIAADVDAAFALYGQKIGRCGLCQRTLTSEWRLRGIGPECVKKL